MEENEVPTNGREQKDLGMQENGVLGNGRKRTETEYFASNAEAGIGTKSYAADLVVLGVYTGCAFVRLLENTVDCLARE